MKSIEEIVNQIKNAVEDAKGRSSFKNIRAAKSFPEFSGGEYHFRILYDTEIKAGLTTNVFEIIYNPRGNVFEIIDDGKFVKISEEEVLNRINDALSK